MNTFLQDFDHRHLIINANLKNPPIRTTVMNDFLTTVVDAIDMKILLPPASVFCDTPGNLGITGSVIIETSHISCHIWNDAVPAFGSFDCYSCKSFDPQKAIRVIDKFFGVISYTGLFIDRNTIDPQAIEYLKG